MYHSAYFTGILENLRLRTASFPTWAVLYSSVPTHLSFYAAVRKNMAIYSPARSLDSTSTSSATLSPTMQSFVRADI